MATDTSNAPVTDDNDDDDDDDEEGTRSGLPRHLRYARNMRTIAGRAVKREAGKQVGMRAWVDKILNRTTDDNAKRVLGIIAEQLDAGAKALQLAADMFEELPDGVGRKVSGVGKDAEDLVIGTKVAIGEKFKPKYEGVLNAQTGLKVASIRKGQVCIEDLSSGTRECFFVPRAHLVIEA